jgi:hypothetical protein
MMNRAVCLSILTLGIAAAFTSVSSEPAAAGCVDFARSPGRFINNCGHRVTVRWTDEFACQNQGGCSIVLRTGETQVVASSRGRVNWSEE